MLWWVRKEEEVERHSGQRMWHQEEGDGSWNGLVLSEEIREGRLWARDCLPTTGREGSVPVLWMRALGPREGEDLMHIHL